MADGAQGLSAPPKPLTSRQRRLMLEAAVERLLSAVDGVLADLNALDGDPDLEPSLAGLNLTGQYGDQRHYARGAPDEREDEHDGREPDVDDEHSLGWAEEESCNARPGLNAFSIPQAENEPSLGAGAHISQVTWGAPSEGWHFDYEHQCEDEGHDSDTEGDVADDS